MLLQLAAKSLLTGYRDQFGELDPLGLASFFAGQVIGTIAERTAVRKVLGALASDLLPGRDDGGPLRDRAEQLGLLRWRQEHLLQGAARRLKGGIDAGRDPFDVLLDCQDHVVEAARAWVDHVVLEAFAAAAGADPGARPPVQPLRAEPRRGRARLLPGARPPDRRAVEGRDPGRQHALRGAAAGRRAARRGVRRAGDDRAAPAAACDELRRSSWESSGSRNS